MAYREMGFLPEALVNYLVRLGWSHGDQEIFSTDEMIAKLRPPPSPWSGSMPTTRA